MTPRRDACYNLMVLVGVVDLCPTEGVRVRSGVQLLPNLTILMGLFVGQGLAQINNVYIAPTATGGSTGADCADALMYSYFNTPGN